MAAQIERVFPQLREFYAALTILVSSSTSAESAQMLRQTGALVRHAPAGAAEGWHNLGAKRRSAVQEALQFLPRATHVHFCDFDRVLHWVESYPAELHQTCRQGLAHEFTVLGRTTRAFASHPRVQRDTERMINHVFALASGLGWDVTSGARILSRRAAQAIIRGCPDDTVGVDCAWPLFLQQQHVALHYVQVEGLEFETLDRYTDQVAALGGAEAWKEQLDTNVREWTRRLAVAHIEVESIAAYSER